MKNLKNLKKNDNEEPRPWKTPKGQIFKELAPYLNIGSQLAITVSLGVLLGWWLDGKFDTKPILIISCSLFAVAVAMYNFFKTIANAEKRKKK